MIEIYTITQKNALIELNTETNICENDVYWKQLKIMVTFFQKAVKRLYRNAISLIDSISFNKWYSRGHCFLISKILLTEKLNQMFFFVNDSSVQEPISDDTETEQTKRVSKKQLSSEGPIKPTDICWVSTPRIQSSCDKLVIFLMNRINVMVEISGCGYHGTLSYNFTDDTK